MILALVLSTGLHDLAALASEISSVTGRVATIDPRLRLPQCGHPVIVSPTDGATLAACTAPAWRVFVPDVRSAGVRPIVARGDTVTVVAGGPGFHVSIDAVAEGAAAAGDRVRLRVPGTAARLVAVVARDGTAMAAGYTFGDAGR